jgi:hypothetical protein
MFTMKSGGWWAICTEWGHCSKWKMALKYWDFSYIYCTVLDEISMVRRGYTKHRARWVLKMFYTKCREWLWFFFRVIPQRWQWISQSHHTSNRWRNQGFVCEFWNQRSVTAVMQTPNKPKMFKQLCQPEIWWQLFSGTAKEYSWCSLCNETTIT